MQKKSLSQRSPGLSVATTVSPGHTSVQAYILVSCAIGLAISYTSIWAQSLISATSFLVPWTKVLFGMGGCAMKEWQLFICIYSIFLSSCNQCNLNRLIWWLDAVIEHLLLLLILPCRVSMYQEWFYPDLFKSRWWSTPTSSLSSASRTLFLGVGSEICFDRINIINMLIDNLR